MKKIYLLLAVVLIAVSCTKPEDDDPILLPTRVVITNNIPLIGSPMGEVNGTLYSTSVLVYNGVDLVGDIAAGDLIYDGGTSSIIELPDYTDKIKLRFNARPDNSSEYNPIKYTAQYYILTKNIINYISIDGNTLVSSSPTKGSSSVKIFK